MTEGKYKFPPFSRLFILLKNNLIVVIAKNYAH